MPIRRRGPNLSAATEFVPSGANGASESPAEAATPAVHFERKAPRRGSWAMVGGNVGVVSEIHGTTAELHIVDANGETTGKILVPLRELQPVTVEQIPQVRRGAP